MKLLMSTSFHPQTDGQSERAIHNVTQILHTVVRPNQTDWVEKIDMVEFAINSSVSESTGYALFELSGGLYALHDQGDTNRQELCVRGKVIPCDGLRKPDRHAQHDN
jgi:hypothetical protein